MSDDEPRYHDDSDDRPPAGVGAPVNAQSTYDTTSPGRDVWRASASFGWLTGTLTLLFAGVGIVLLLLRVPASSGGQRMTWVIATMILIALAIGIVVLLRALPTMRYRFVDDAIVVEWLGQRRVVPVAEITDVTYEPGTPLRLPGWEPFWPGYYVATVRTPAGTWHTWATQQPHRRVRLATSHGIVAISPERPIRFIAELERRRYALGQQTSDTRPESIPVARQSDVEWPVATSLDIQPVSMPPPTAAITPDRVRARKRDRRPRDEPATNRHPLTNWMMAYRDQFRNQFMADQVASALVALGVVLPVLMVAYLYSQYEALPGQMPVQWDAAGDVSETTTPGGLWRFPRIAVVILVVNTALATLLFGIDRYLARLLAAGIPVVQIILFIALVRAIN